ncbi:MAG: Smr/MutS family protein [Parvularculaceae bacterium]
MRRRGLTPDEEALWRKAMRDVSAYRGKGHAPQRLVSPSQEIMTARPARAYSASPAASAPAPAAHPFDAGDPALDRRAGRGRIAIDAVLDLHGHTQETAHGALNRFVAGWHGRGARCLLVITGKGGGQSGAGGGRGVLKSRFEEWLTEEPLRRLVSRASPAYRRHGGGGAFYVFLKR